MSGSKIVTGVNGSSWVELSAEAKGCIENQCGRPLLLWVSATQPADSLTKGHNLGHTEETGFEIDVSVSMKVWGRTLSGGGDVMVTEF
ncbi:hypothetical protein WOB69_00895 [Vibrio parahaemolyticus]